MTKKKKHFVKTTSRRTGKIILICAIVFISIAVVFGHLAMTEARKIADNETKWRLMSCDDMLKDSIADPAPWKTNAIIDKGC